MNKVITALALVLLMTPLVHASDFSYSYADPKDGIADDYIVHTVNAELFTEDSYTFWKPAQGAQTLERSEPGFIVYHFPFSEAVQSGELFMRTSAFHWAYSQGQGSIFGSTDGSSWLMLAQAETPEIGQVNVASFQGPLPKELIGAKDLWLKVELTSYGIMAGFGGIRTNTAQHSRYDANADNTTFRLEVDFQEPQVQETEHQLDIVMNSEVNIPGTTFGCSLAVQPGTASGQVDLYVAIGLPGGLLYLLGPQSLETELVACRTDIAPEDVSGVILPDFPLPSDLPHGQYHFFALLVKVGTDLSNEQNWVSNMAYRSMFFTPLSPAQQAFVDELGHPQQFVKIFGHDGEGPRVDETWVYLERGLGENFINGVFVYEKTLKNSLEAVPEALYRPDRYHMDTTLEQVRSWHGDPLETFTDVLDIGTHLTCVYDGIIFSFLDEQIISVISGK